MTTSRTPVLFIHGLWLHASSWEPWLDLFAEAGYAPMAPGWPGDPETVELARANPDSIAGHGIDDVTSHYAGIIAELPVRPVIIGHRRETAGPGPRRGGDRDRCRADQGRAAASRCPRCGPPCRSSRIPPTPIAPYRSPPRSSASRSGTRYHRRSRTRSMSGGRSLPRASRSSRRLPPTSHRTRPPRSTPATPGGARCC